MNGTSGLLVNAQENAAEERGLIQGQLKLMQRMVVQIALEFQK